MITKLSIKNYALIDDISVDFSNGLTIITGETGAGKSILLGALSLLLGKRADLKSVRNHSEKCIIEGEFKFTDAITEKIFDKNNLDYDTHSILRRELLPSGKSRAFVNDTPVSLQQLQNLAPYLIDIHSQHDTLELFSETFQLEVIDALVENSELIKKYEKELDSFNEVSETINDLIYKKESALKELDYNTFLYKELTEENLETLNQESLEENFQVLNNSETIQDSLSQIINLLSSEQIGSLETLKETRIIIGNLRQYSAKYEEIWKRLDSVIIELEDVSEEIENTITTVEVNPLLLAEVNQKLQVLYKLQQKHSVETIEELLEIQSSLASKIEVTNNLDEKIIQLQDQQKKLKLDVTTLANEIHKNRIKIIPVLKERLKKYLSELGLPNADFKFDFSTSEKFRKNGTDILQLLFTANKGMPFGTIKKVASGGELSRLMLSIKAVLAQYKKLPTLVFDEIDSGVSGEISYKMASILKEMSATMQLFCITHLPQVAAKGNHHIKIQKEIINNTTITKLHVLTNEERVNELAEMIGGKNHTKTAITQAMELLN